MKIHLFDHFTYKRILRFALPSVVMMIFTSVYGIWVSVVVAEAMAVAATLLFLALNKKKYKY